MHQDVTRRDVLKATAAIGAGLWLGSDSQPARAVSANEKLNVALVGIGGQGGANLNRVAKQNIVALCDVDDKRAGKAYERFSKAKKFYDYRRMLDQMDRQIDAVVVSTPDHTHFHISMMALQMGKHLYCEKPMAHSVYEIRKMTELAQEKKVATQLGVQRHTILNMHRVVELIQSGAIGKVTEVHSWIGGNRGMPKIPTDRPEIPKGLRWDLWLGPAAERPYHTAYCPYGWRFWWDFGTGETGNWGCHILDIPFWALGLTYPNKVAGIGPPVHPQTTPKQMTTRLDFPADGERGPVVLNWYHARSGPEILRKLKLNGSGMNNLFIGTDGMLLCGFGKRQLLPESKFEGFKEPAHTIPKSPGFHQEWFDACKGGKLATCHFGYSGPLSETVLLANTAYRAGGRFQWDAANLKATGNDKVDQFLTPTFRKGWEI